MTSMHRPYGTVVGGHCDLVRLRARRADALAWKLDASCVMAPRCAAAGRPAARRAGAAAAGLQHMQLAGAQTTNEYRIVRRGVACLSVVSTSMFHRSHSQTPEQTRASPPTGTALSMTAPKVDRRAHASQSPTSQTQNPVPPPPRVCESRDSPASPSTATMLQYNLQVSHREPHAACRREGSTA